MDDALAPALDSDETRSPNEVLADSMKKAFSAADAKNRHMKRSDSPPGACKGCQFTDPFIKQGMTFTEQISHSKEKGNESSMSYPFSETKASGKYTVTTTFDEARGSYQDDPELDPSSSSSNPKYKIGKTHYYWDGIKPVKVEVDRNVDASQKNELDLTLGGVGAKNSKSTTEGAKYHGELDVNGAYNVKERSKPGHELGYGPVQPNPYGGLTPFAPSPAPGTKP